MQDIQKQLNQSTLTMTLTFVSTDLRDANMSLSMRHSDTSVGGPSVSAATQPR